MEGTGRTVGNLGLGQTADRQAVSFLLGFLIRFAVELHVSPPLSCQALEAWGRYLSPSEQKQPVCTDDKMGKFFKACSKHLKESKPHFQRQSEGEML